MSDKRIVESNFRATRPSPGAFLLATAFDGQDGHFTTIGLDARSDMSEEDLPQHGCTTKLHACDQMFTTNCLSKAGLPGNFEKKILILLIPKNAEFRPQCSH